MDMKEPMSFEKPESSGAGAGRAPRHEEPPKKTYHESNLWNTIVAKDEEMRKKLKAEGKVALDSEPIRKAMLERMIKNLEDQGHTVVRNKKS